MHDLPVNYIFFLEFFKKEAKYDSLCTTFRWFISLQMYPICQNIKVSLCTIIIAARKLVKFTHSII